MTGLSNATRWLLELGNEQAKAERDAFAHQKCELELDAVTRDEKLHAFFRASQSVED